VTPEEPWDTIERYYAELAPVMERLQRARREGAGEVAALWEAENLLKHLWAEVQTLALETDPDAY
jgi:predicted metal-dependent hydrolase